MKYAIISDIHSNLEALCSVLDVIDSEGVERIICLGDIVGYGADPNRCVEIIKERNIPSVLGNHDAVACGIYEPMLFNDMATHAALWTRNELHPENRLFLSELPEKLTIDSFLAVHGAISDPDKYILSAYDARPEFSIMGEKTVCFFGHTHVAVTYFYANNRVDTFSPSFIAVERGAKYLINPGSVGQPRDRDPRASFVIYDDEGTVEYRRVEYDIKTTQEKILKTGLDRKLAERLSYGI